MTGSSSGLMALLIWDVQRILIPLTVTLYLSIQVVLSIGVVLIQEKLAVLAASLVLLVTLRTTFLSELLPANKL